MKFELHVQVKLPDGTFQRLPLALDFGEGIHVAQFETFRDAVEYCASALPGHPTIEEVE